MKSGRASLNAQIARLEQLGKMPRDVAPAVAEAVERELRASIARGEAPDGKPWPRTKDGAVALSNAAAACTVRAVGDTIVIRVSGVEARHHLGAVKGGIRRQIIPTGTIPASYSRAIGRVVDEAFAGVMRGAA